MAAVTNRLTTLKQDRGDGSSAAELQEEITVMSSKIAALEEARWTSQTAAEEMQEEMSAAVEKLAVLEDGVENGNNATKSLREEVATSLLVAYCPADHNSLR